MNASDRCLPLTSAAGWVMIGESGQEYCEDLNKSIKDVSSTLIVRSHNNTHVSVPCRFPLHLFPSNDSSKCGPYIN